MANVKLTFSSNMEHPTAGDTAGDEGWTAAPGFIKAEFHWLLGHTPDYIVCYFHASDQRQFPWVRARAYDENGEVGIWRFDTIEEQFEGGQRQWKAIGRCALYGAVDNFMRSPRIKADQAIAEDDEDLDDDPNYTEWPILHPRELVTLEDLKARFASDHFRVGSCEQLIKETGCGGALSPCSGGGDQEEDCDTGKHSAPHFPYCHDASLNHLYDSQEETYSQAGSPCVYENNNDRDLFLYENFRESRYNVENTKLGPNYTWKGVRRGWVFKDILRHSSGTHDSASRPILGVYNLTKPNNDPITDEGEAIRSNFQQSQQPGAGASALAHDVAISWPWIAPEEEEVDTGEETYEGDTGYDYRTVWPGKEDRYASSGQAVELFERGSEPWDDLQGFACPGNDFIPCPNEGPDGVMTYLTYFQALVLSHIALDHYPTREEICELKPDTRGSIVAGVGVIVTVIDHALGSYNVTRPSSVSAWINRFGLVPLTGPGLSNFGANGYVICNSTAGHSNPCWCETHSRVICNWNDCFGYTSGLIGLWMTPPETIVLNPPSDKQCKELDPTKNIAVFLHKGDPSKDYLCYHEVA